MDNIQDKLREIQFELFMNWMWKNHFWYEVITTGLLVVAILGVIISVVCMIWVSFWWWKIGMTSFLLFLMTKAVYANLMPRFYEQYQSRK